MFKVYIVMFQRIENVKQLQSIYNT